MTEAQLAPISPATVAADLSFADLRGALAAGLPLSWGRYWRRCEGAVTISC